MKIACERRSGIGTFAIVLVAVFVILVAVVAYDIFVTGATNGVPASTTTSTTPTTTTTSSAQPKTVQASMPNGVGSSQSLNFQPANITLVIGVNNTVMWTNNDGAPHTVTATSVPSGVAKFDSGNMNSGATFTYTFTVPGTYKYGCTYHFWMLGTVVVKQAA